MIPQIDKQKDPAFGGNFLTLVPFRWFIASVGDL